MSRPYYHCPAGCGGHSPRDAALRLGTDRLSVGATRAVALAGVMGSFAERTLPELCGVRVSESTVERTTERVGAVVGDRLAAGETFGEAKPWGWSEDSEEKTVGSVSADLTGVGRPGANAGEAEGRMAAVGMVWNAGRPGQVRYVCGLTGGRAALGEPLRRQAGQVGLDRAQRWRR